MMNTKTKRIITFILAAIMVLSLMLGLLSTTLFAAEIPSNAPSPVVLSQYAFFKPGTLDQVKPVPGGTYDLSLYVYEVGNYDHEYENLRAFISGGDFTQEKTTIFKEYYPFYDWNHAQVITFSNVKYSGSSDVGSVRIMYDTIDWDDNVSTQDTSLTFSLSGGTSSGESSTLKPRIIIQKYDFGGQSVTAGTTFPLVITIKNTSTATNIENLVMTLEPMASQNAQGSETAFAIASSSNSFFINKLAAGQTHTETVEVSVLATASPASYKMAITFDYNYKDSPDATSAETISIPVFQPDRFSVSPIEDLPVEMMAGEEVYISVPFINKGKSQISNLSAKLVANNINGQQEQYIGNVQSGTEDSVEFALIGEPGLLEGNIIFTYEDANLIEKEVPVPFSITVMDSGMGGGDMDMFPDGEFPMEPFPGEPSGRGTFPVIPVIIGAVVIVGIIVVVIVLKKRKKAKLLQEEEDDEIY